MNAPLDACRDATTHATTHASTNAIRVLDQAVATLDLARGATLRFLTKSAALTRLLARRETRLALFGAAQVGLTFALTLRWPVAMFFLGPVVLGVVHVAADVRYLALRQDTPRPLLAASVVLAAGLTLVRLGAGLKLLDASRGAEVDIALGVAWVGVALALRLQGAPKKRALALTLLGAALVPMLTHAKLVDLALTHAHNVAAIALWLVLFRNRSAGRGSRRAGWDLLPLVLVVGASAVLLSGRLLPWTAQHGGLFAFGQRAARLGQNFAPGASRQTGIAIAMTFVFLQSIHYAVLTGWIPQECLAGEGSPTFRMTLRGLQRDFRVVGLAAIVLVTLGFAVAAASHLRESVAWYMTLARAHVWFELAVFAYFVGLPRGAATAR